MAASLRIFVAIGDDRRWIVVGLTATFFDVKALVTPE